MHHASHALCQHESRAAVGNPAMLCVHLLRSDARMHRAPCTQSPGQPRPADTPPAPCCTEDQAMTQQAVTDGRHCGSKWLNTPFTHDYTTSRHCCPKRFVVPPDGAHAAALGRLPGDQLPQDDAEGVDVHLVGALGAHQHLWRRPHKGAWQHRKLSFTLPPVTLLPLSDGGSSRHWAQQTAVMSVGTSNV